LFVSSPAEEYYTYAATVVGCEVVDAVLAYTSSFENLHAPM